MPKTKGPEFSRINLAEVEFSVGPFPALLCLDDSGYKGPLAIATALVVYQSPNGGPKPGEIAPSLSV